MRNNLVVQEEFIIEAPKAERVSPLTVTTRRAKSRARYVVTNSF